MTPGDTKRPSASIVRSARAVTRPISTMVPSLTATSARYRGQPRRDRTHRDEERDDELGHPDQVRDGLHAEPARVEPREHRARRHQGTDGRGLDRGELEGAEVD